jgi:thiamine pyrophosphate-dependent acetolactate synthase large subunit-like protein
MHQLWALRNMDFDFPHNVVSSNSFAPVGVGLPTTMGVVRASALHNKTRNVSGGGEKRIRESYKELLFEFVFVITL